MAKDKKKPDIKIVVIEPVDVLDLHPLFRRAALCGPKIPSQLTLATVLASVAAVLQPDRPEEDQQRILTRMRAALMEIAGEEFTEDLELQEDDGNFVDFLADMAADLHAEQAAESAPRAADAAGNPSPN